MAAASALRQPSVNSQQSQSSQSSQQSAALSARIASKKAELEDLRHLRDLSGTLAGQMAQLEEKLGTLRDGTEAVAMVMANWDHVLKAISLASMKAAKVAETNGQAAQEKEAEEDEGKKLPVTLIRIPVQERESVERAIQAQGQGNEDGNGTQTGD